MYPFHPTRLWLPWHEGVWLPCQLPYLCPLSQHSCGLHLSFDPIHHSAPLNMPHYVQPRCPPSTYPSKVSPTLSVATPSPDSPAVMDNDNDNVPHLCMAVPSIHSSSTSSNNIDMSSLSTHLKDLTDALRCLTLPPPQPP
jgi:hypothetical protein